MNIFSIDGNSNFFYRFTPTTKSVRVWLTRDRTGVQIWRTCPAFDDDANAFYGGEMLHLLDHGSHGNMAMNCCVAIMIPLTLHHHSETSL